MVKLLWISRHSWSRHRYENQAFSSHELVHGFRVGTTNPIPLYKTPTLTVFLSHDVKNCFLRKTINTIVSMDKICDRKTEDYEQESTMLLQDLRSNLFFFSNAFFWNDMVWLVTHPYPNAHSEESFGLPTLMKTLRNCKDFCKKQKLKTSNVRTFKHKPQNFG